MCSFVHMCVMLTCFLCLVLKPSFRHCTFAAVCNRHPFSQCNYKNADTQTDTDGFCGGHWKGRNPNSTALPPIMNVIVSKCVLAGERSFGDRQDYVQVREALYGAQLSLWHHFL